MRRVGLVLGAGGIVGQAYHAGVLRALADAGWDPASSEIIVGTSAGSLVGAMLRRGMSLDELAAGGYRKGEIRMGGAAQPGLAGTAEEAVAAPAALSGTTLTGRARLGGHLARLVPPGRISPGGIVRLVQAVGGDTWPQQPTWLCSVRRLDGRRVVFGAPSAPAAPFSKAVAASCAIPGYFQPVRIDSADGGAAEDYVDGGAHSPTNLDLLAGRGLDLVVAVSPMSFSGPPSARLDLGARLLFRTTLAREARQVSRRGSPVLTIQPGADALRVMGLNAMSPRRWQEVVDTATASAERQLAVPATRRLLTG